MAARCRILPCRFIPDAVMTLLLNLAWFIIGGGFFAGIGWLFTGLLLALSVVGLPFAFAAWRIAGFAAWPFGRTLVDVRDLGEEPIIGTGIANLIWIIVAGIWLWIGHVMAGIGLCCTIIGIPFGLAHFRLAAVSFAPLGKRVQET
jgi:uncharacterized membrane protein YccF (DUF307 family)